MLSQQFYPSPNGTFFLPFFCLFSFQFQKQRRNWTEIWSQDVCCVRTGRRILEKKSFLPVQNVFEKMNTELNLDESSHRLRQRLQKKGRIYAIREVFLIKRSKFSVLGVCGGGDSKLALFFAYISYSFFFACSLNKIVFQPLFIQQNTT